MGNFNKGRNDGSRFGNRGGSRGFGGGKRGGGGRGFGGRNERPQLHDATCDNCGNDCQVPFRPTGDRPVLCNNCFDKSKRSGGREKYDNSRSFRSERPVPASQEASSEKHDEILAKLDKIINLLQRANPIKEVTVMKAKPEKKAPAKKAPVKKAAKAKAKKAAPKKTTKAKAKTRTKK